MLVAGVFDVDGLVVEDVISTVVCGVLVTLGVVELVVGILLPFFSVVVTSVFSVDRVAAIVTKLVDMVDVEVDLKNKVND